MLEKDKNVRESDGIAEFTIAIDKLEAYAQRIKADVERFEDIRRSTSHSASNPNRPSQTAQALMSLPNVQLTRMLTVGRLTEPREVFEATNVVFDLKMESGDPSLHKQKLVKEIAARMQFHRTSSVLKPEERIFRLAEAHRRMQVMLTERVLALEAVARECRQRQTPLCIFVELEHVFLVVLAFASSIIAVVNGYLGTVKVVVGNETCTQDNGGVMYNICIGCLTAFGVFASAVGHCARKKVDLDKVNTQISLKERHLRRLQHALVLFYRSNSQDGSELNYIWDQYFQGSFCRDEQELLDLTSKAGTDKTEMSFSNFLETLRVTRKPSPLNNVLSTIVEEDGDSTISPTSPDLVNHEDPSTNVDVPSPQVTDETKAESSTEIAPETKTTTSIAANPFEDMGI